MLEFYKLWINILLHKTKPVDIANTNFTTGIKHLILSSVISSIIGAFYFFAMLENIEQLIPAPADALSKKIMADTLASFVEPIKQFSSGSGIGLAIFVMVLGVLSTLLMVTIFFAAAKLLGGKGKYENYAGTTLLIVSSFNGTIFLLVNLVTALMFLTKTYSLFGEIIGALQFAISLYWYYLLVKTIQAIHKISSARAVAALILGLIAIVLIFLIVGLIIFFAIIGSFVQTLQQ